MKQTIRLSLLLLATLGACRQAEKSAPPMAGMTPEEHARVATPAPAGDSTLAGRMAIHLTAAQAQAIGVTFATVERGALRRTVRTVGQIVPAESRLADVTARIDGFVERLFVNATGLAVRRGDPLLTLYSPMLVSAEEELLTARRLAAGMDSSNTEAWRNARALVEAARRRLDYWNISAEQIARLESTGEVTKTLTLTAPTDGIVLEKMVVEGQTVMAGMKLYRLADLSTVWIEGDVFEQDLAAVRVGSPARVELAAYPGRLVTGQVSFVSPVVDEQSRTARVRVVLPNSAATLRPGMYGTLFFDVVLGADILSVPAEAVVMTGARNLVFVLNAEGTYEPRQVTLGAAAGGRVQVLAGLAAGERIVASANFLVDAESRLGSAAGMAGMPGMDMSKKKDRP
jgi:Cu(I)/Ag(I) efflux system membrane fusion protein